MKRNTIKKEAKEISDADREQFKKDWKMLAGRLKGSKPKGQKEFDAFKKKPVDESPSSVECDGCGRIVHDDDVQIVGDQVLCSNCRSGFWQESKKSENWMGIPDATFIDTGSHSEPEVEYRGITLEYGDVDDNLWEIYQEDHPEDPEGKDYPRWVKKNPRYVECVLEELYDKAVAENPEQFDEGMEEDVLDMPDRVDELESEIEKLWVRLGDVDEDTVMELIADYVELEKIEPGRVEFLR